jgi:hypothetical protein
MPPRADEPLRKVTLNLYEIDCLTMEAAFGHGWTAIVREWLNEKASHIRKPGLTIGDLADD